MWGCNCGRVELALWCVGDAGGGGFFLGDLGFFADNAEAAFGGVVGGALAVESGDAAAVALYLSKEAQAYRRPLGDLGG